ncbi:MAG TPA: methylenetetrahydrofolate reductase [Gammaproteobacteria bacterium]|jgi:methylenetetrahydrofolate reductase (NADPH)
MTRAELSRDELKRAIAAFVSGYSIEVTPHDAKNAAEFPHTLKPGTTVYVAHPPGIAIDAVVEFAGQLKAQGFVPVPHIIARKLESREQLDRVLAACEKLGVDEALAIAGDIAVPNNAFESSLEVLQTGLFGHYGFREVGVAGHPEGSKAIGEKRVAEALAGKVAFAKTAPFKMRFVTQFGFEPDAVTEWEQTTRAAGIELPIHVGMAGPASLKQLVKFAAMCGIGSSARMLATRTGAMANLLRTQAPDELITSLARHRAAHPDSRLRRAHFFCFGGVLKSARWANGVVAGSFELNRDATGFTVTENG